MTDNGKLYEIIDNSEIEEGEQLALPGLEPIEETEADSIITQMGKIQLDMDIMRYPGGSVNEEIANRSFDEYFDMVIDYVARKTKASPEDVKNPETRTPEQDYLIRDTIVAIGQARMFAFLKSAYMEALNTLEPTKGNYADPGDIGEPTEFARLVTQLSPTRLALSLKEQAVLYFFALHDEMNPAADASENPLTEEQKAELQGIFIRLDSFYIDSTSGKSHDPENLDILRSFIRHENPTPGTAESITAKLPLLQGIKPMAHAMPNTPLMNVLQYKQAINAGAFDMVVSNAKGRRKEITAYTMIDIDPGETGIAITDAKLTEYERQVSDAIISLWIEADKRKLLPIFTLDMIYRAMPGGGDKASPQQKGAITKAIEKFRRLHIYVDATEEFVKRGIIAPGEKYIFDEYYLNLRRHIVQSKNGKVIVQGYEGLTQPVMLTYSKLTKQILTISAKHLAIEKVKKGRASGELITMTADRQAITGYMLRRIAIMKHDRKNKKPIQSNVILFDTLFKDTNTKTENRKQTMINRNFCFEVLDFWKVSGFIKGYKKQEKGRSITGIIIEF